MSRTFQPCCERIALELTEAPRLEGANPSPDVIRCASCGSTIPIEKIAAAKRDSTFNLATVLTKKIGLRRAKPQRKIETKIKYWLKKLPFVSI